MVEVVWRQSAKIRLERLRVYLTQVAGPRTAKRMHDRILKATRRLAAQPLMGAIEFLAADASQGYRSVVVHKNHKVVYRFDGKTVNIVTLYDCRQNPDRLSDEVTES